MISFGTKTGIVFDRFNTFVSDFKATLFVLAYRLTVGKKKQHFRSASPEFAIP